MQKHMQVVKYKIGPYCVPLTFRGRIVGFVLKLSSMLE